MHGRNTRVPGSKLPGIKAVAYYRTPNELQGGDTLQHKNGAKDKILMD